MIKLGSQVRDKFTGFKGVAISRTEDIHGSMYLYVVPHVDDTGRMEYPQGVDIAELRLEVISTEFAKKDKELEYDSKRRREFFLSQVDKNVS